MFYKETHLSDEDLLLAADGELAARRLRQVKRHLESCWTCRARKAALEHTIADVVDCYHSQDVHSTIGGSGEAGLRARLAAASAPPVQQPRQWTWLTGAACALAMALTAGVLVTNRPASVIPNPALTPGEAVAVSTSNVCGANSGKANQEVPDQLKEAVFKEYGLNNAPRNAYEVDFLITPALGGSAGIRNLWPEPYNSSAWNAHTKDVLENRLHSLVCSGQVDLSTAQREIASNWVEAYKKYVRP
jgi:hypothetical protein